MTAAAVSLKLFEILARAHGMRTVTTAYAKPDRRGQVSDDKVQAFVF